GRTHHLARRAPIGRAAQRHACRCESLRFPQWNHNQRRSVGQVGTATAVKNTTTEFSGLTADSREVKPGFLFAALKGTKADGGGFIEDAVKRGAVVVLGLPERADEVRKLGVGFIADKNPRLRLALLAAEFYGAQPRCVAAVTGTNGKTSVAHFLRQIWSSEGLSAASIGTIGVY